MAKIILLHVVALFMIFSLFLNYGNATTPRKLGVRYNAVTSLSNIDDATFGGLGFARKLGSGRDQDSPILGLSAQEHTITPGKLGARQFGITCLSNTNCAILGGSGHLYPSISSSSAHANEATPRKLGSRQNVVTSLPNTNEVISDGSKDQYSPISSSSAHTNAPQHYPIIDPTIFTNEAIARKHGTYQNPIIVTSLSNTNEAINTGESELHSSLVSRSPTQTNVVLPRKPGSGHVSSIIN
ncbi:hypothetical protein HAX54_045959 [Datura stramonium]|uniref:Uncharacterized protein n=1 Tax=Datura stramonium TaxID=4076 RepID=A0ABS8SR31_DATST|nr:hypothetical protein [Datura stramonium]